MTRRRYPTDISPLPDPPMDDLPGAMVVPSPTTADDPWAEARDRATWENQAWQLGAQAERDRIINRLEAEADAMDADPFDSVSVGIGAAAFRDAANLIREEVATQAPQGAHSHAEPLTPHGEGSARGDGPEGRTEA